jgi:uracil-DNA glycosylase family 4
MPATCSTRRSASSDDGLELVDAAITNAVRCVPPQNKPEGAEIANCRQFLTPTLAAFPNLSAVLALGAIAHQSTVRALGGRVAAHPFKHGGRTEVGGVTLFSSYHCSRYNTNTGVLTTEMFEAVFGAVREFVGD